MRISLAVPVRAWQGFLFASGELKSLALFRIGWSLAMLLETYQDWAGAAHYDPGHYHLAAVAGLPAVTPSMFSAAMWISAIGAALTLVGVVPRAAAIAVVLAQGYLFASDLLLFRNHIYLGLLLGLLLAAAPSANVWSLPAWLRALRGHPAPAVGSRACVQLIKAQVSIVYAYSALNKLRPAFVDGFALQQELPFAMHASVLRPLFELPGGGLRPAVAQILGSDTAMSACAVGVVAVEAFLAFALWSARLRRHAIALGLLLHAAIFLSMDVLTFGMMLVATYPLFLESHPFPFTITSPSSS